VRDLTTGRIEITTQNHGFVVDVDSIGDAATVTHLHLNDGSVEGLAHKSLPAFSVQYHPESAAGPHDSLYLFERFTSAF
jgi:carbamoyl-phosphate synthase small subunit